MWTAENRGRYDRSRLRYPSDLTDEEWALIAPRIPPAKRGGNKTHRKAARDCQRANVHPEHGLPMAGDSERPAAALDLVRLFRSVEL
jgi:transposase